MAFLTFLMCISFICTVILKCADKEFGSKLTTGYKEELEVEKKEATKLGLTLNETMNRTFTDDLRERSFIGGRRFRTLSRVSTYGIERHKSRFLSDATFLAGLG